VTPETASAPQHQLAPYVKAIRRRAGLIALVTLAALGVSLALSLTATKQYTAVARLFLHQENPVNNIVSTGGDQAPADPQRDLNSRVSLITSQTVAQQVIDKLGLHTTTKKLLEDKVSADVDGDTDIAQVSVKDPDPQQAARIANEFADQYVSSRRDASRATILEAAKLAQSQLDQLTPVERAGAQGRELARRARELQINAALQTGNVEIVGHALVPEDPSSPRTVLSAIVALILGLLVGLALAVGLEFLDRRVRDLEDVEAYGRPILASIPQHEGPIAEVFEADFAVREAFLTFATSLRFFNLGREVNVLAITSPGPGEGKTSATLGLAAALTNIGLRVVTIESDLRRPMFGQYLGIEGGAGLSTVLAGVSTFEHELVDVDARTLQPMRGSGSSDTPYFSILSAGPIPPNPQGLLSSPEMSNVVARARAIADVVLLDTAPIGTVNDVVTLAELTNGIALLVRLGQTRRDALNHALRVLDNVPAPVLGFVVNGARRGGARYYGYDRPNRSRDLVTN
jgi:capsular exopolysaccharide synthesis family protein